MADDREQDDVEDLDDIEDDTDDLDDADDDDDDTGAAASGAGGDDDDDLDDDDDPAGGTADEDRPKPKNLFDERRSLTDIADEVERESRGEKKSKPAGGNAEGADDDSKAGKKKDPADGGEAEGRKPKPADAEDDDDEDEGKPAKPRYKVVNAKGEELDFEWEDGATVVFKGDGKDVTVKSLDELVQLGQKGAAFDRLVPELRTRVTQATEHATSLEQDLEQLHETADRTLLAALFGSKEVRTKLRDSLAKFRDPDYVEGQRAIAEREERKKTDQERESAENEESRKEFWTQVGARMGELFKSEKFPLLDENDAQEITARFYRGYEQTFTEQYKHHLGEGKSKAAAERLAQEAAYDALSDKNLRRTMRTLNEELQAKLDRKRGKPAGERGKPKGSEDDARREAQQHNDRTREKLNQRTRPKLRGGPNGGTPAAQARGRENGGKPLTFDQRIGRATKILRGARTDDGGDDDE